VVVLRNRDGHCPSFSEKQGGIVLRQVKDLSDMVIGQIDAVDECCQATR